MDALFGFLGSYWWLVFPLMGVAGPISAWWSKNAKERHQRRLEVMRTKAELAQATRHTDPEAIAEADAAGRTQRLARLMDTHDEVSRRWLDYELDAAKLIAFPTMSDGRDPHTAAFLRAKKVADGLRPASAEARVDAETYAEYRDAVHDFEVAFDIAEQEARRVRDTGFTESERQRLTRAQHMLSVAVDQSATAAERQTAYRRIREELDGLIVLSDAAESELRQRVAGELEA
ncbi:hypothetical protein [Microbacterium karelineae]|uniref:hypothetical protein n=1 Tax=Microbacterium karelineae TaxID=2654283 RepID=UPI0012EA3202|nr:hypothetical protein [Microbacterium karelineae]